MGIADEEPTMKLHLKILCLILFSFFLKPVGAAIDFPNDGFITLNNVHLNEEITVQYRLENGIYNQEALKKIAHTLRCRLTNTEQAIPVELIELVDEIQDHFRATRVDIISGFRSPKLNQTLRRQGRRVATNSYHLQAKAMDVRLPGVSANALRKYALSLQRGGVGYYPSHQFVHVDIGPVRQW